MNILCTGNKNKKDFLNVLINVKKIIDNSKSNFYIDEDKLLLDYNFKSVTFNDLEKNNINLVISIGGDGSLLSSIQKMKNNQIPILGIHIGNLGFLNQLDISNYEKLLPTIINNKKVPFEKNMLISASVYNADDELEYNFLGFNDIVINHGKLLKLINVKLSLNNSYLNSYICDGLIFSTSLGSTAYSLSAGGPIVAPDIDSIIITPISSHSLSSRSIVISSNNCIKVEFTSKENNNINIVSDGQNYEKINNTYKVLINKSKIESKILKVSGIDDYYSKLRNKIGW